MDLRANIDGHGIALKCADEGFFVDAASVGGIAGVELPLTGTVTINERDDKRSNILSLSMAPAQLRELGLVALEKSGAPVFTASEWQDIALALEQNASEGSVERAHRIRLYDYARQIREAYQS